MIIRTLVGPERWFYVPTSVNPADIAKQVISPRKFSESELWWKGPNFLTCKKEIRPVQEIAVENKNSLVEAEEKQTVALVVVEGSVRIGDVIDCRQFGKLSKLLSVTSYVYRFVNNFKARYGRNCQQVVGELTLVEIQRSKLKWVQYEQAMIKQEKDIEKLKVSLNVFEDSDNILRLKSRFAQNDEIKFSSKFPILLRNDSYFTKLVIFNFHEYVYHNGTEGTFNRLRTEYWVIRGCQSVKRVLRECIVCKYVNKKPAQPVSTPQLLDYRVQCNHAFEVVGIDYAGPLFCKDIFRSNDDVHKCYILLFTCAFSRAVHLESTSDLKAENLLLDLKRFISRRGKSTKFISDNAKTFKKSKKLKSFLVQKNIMWNFISEKAPWWGWIL